MSQLSEQAKQITVKIENLDNQSNGSGIIIAKQGNTYYVLTCEHVVSQQINYQLVTPDGQSYPLNYTQIEREEGVDLAVVKFTSNQPYQVATLANYHNPSRDYIFVAGYPRLKKSQSNWRVSLGSLFSAEGGVFETQDSSAFTEGYELVYSNITYGGMSGGPVLDSLGRVVGIHGRAEGEVVIDEASEDLAKVQLGYSLGIPSNTFISLANRLKVDSQWLQIQKEQPPELDRQRRIAIQDTLMLTSVSQKKNPKASQWLERGNLLWRLKRYDEAINAFDEVIKLNPDFVELAWYGQGRVLFSQRKYTGALASFEKASGKKADFYEAWRWKARTLRRLKRLDKALVAVEKAIKIQPRSAILHSDKANILAELKKYDQAITSTTEAIKISPRAAFYNDRGIFYKQQEKWDLALADYNKAIQLNPDYARAYNNRGILYYEQKKSDLALADSLKAIELDPNLASAYSSRGNIYSDQKKWDLALADYDKAIKLNPDYARAYNGRGNMYSDQKKWDLALADYNKAIELDPDYVWPYNNRGILYQEQKKWDLALADYNKAIQLDSDFSTAYNNRGILYQEQKKWDLALADYNKAIEIDPDYARAYYRRGIVYKHLGNKQKARNDLQIAAPMFERQGNKTLHQKILDLLRELDSDLTQKKN